MLSSPQIKVSALFVLLAAAASSGQLPGLDDVQKHVDEINDPDYDILNQGKHTYDDIDSGEYGGKQTLERLFENLNDLTSENPMNPAEVLAAHQELYGTWGDWMGVDIPENFAEAWNAKSFTDALNDAKVDTILVTGCHIKLLGVSLYVTRSVSIVGVCRCALEQFEHLGSRGCALDGDKRSRIMSIRNVNAYESMQVDFYNMVMTEGNGRHGEVSKFHGMTPDGQKAADVDGEGGAVFVNGASVSFHNVTFYNNRATSGMGGGAVNVVGQPTGTDAHFVDCNWTSNHDAVNNVETDIKLGAGITATFQPFPPMAEVEMAEGATLMEGGSAITDRMKHFKGMPLIDADLPGLGYGLFQYRPQIEIDRDAPQKGVDEVDTAMKNLIAGNNGNRTHDPNFKTDDGTSHGLSPGIVVVVVVVVVMVVCGGGLGLIVFMKGRPQAPNFSEETQGAGAGDMEAGSTSFKKMEEEFERSQTALSQERAEAQQEAAAEEPAVAVAVEDPPPQE